MKMRINKKFIRAIVLLLLVLTGLLLVGWNAYSALYRHKTVVIESSIDYEKMVPFIGLAVYDEEAVPLPEGSYTLAPDVIDKRVGVHQRVGTVTKDVNLNPSEGGANLSITDRVIEAIRNGQAAALTIDEIRPEKPTEAVNDEDRLPSERYLVDLGDAPFLNEGTELLTNRAGILKGQLDGYEEIASWEAMRTLRAGDIRSILHLTNPPKARPGLVLINNLHYGILIETETPITKPDEKVRLRIGEEEVTGTVFRFESSEDHSVLSVYSDRWLSSVMKERSLRGTITDIAYRAFALPVSAVFEKDNQQGVYIKSNDAIVTFVPIGRYQKDGEQVFIDVTESELALYDEVFLHPGSIKEGDFIE